MSHQQPIINPVSALSLGISILGGVLMAVGFMVIGGAAVAAGVGAFFFSYIKKPDGGEKAQEAVKMSVDAFAAADNASNFDVASIEQDFREAADPEAEVEKKPEPKPAPAPVVAPKM